VRFVASLPAAIAGIPVPQDDVSAASWDRMQRALPAYLLAHSVRSYCWGAVIAGREGWSFDRQILWSAALWHDVGLTRLARNTMCFEVEGAELSRPFLERNGLPAEAADRVAIAIILHMQPNVTLDDGVEAVLLDRATGLDVRGVEFELVDDVRDAVVEEFPRGAFDRRFVAAVEHEAGARPDCRSAVFVRADLAGWMARSPWAALGRGRPARSG
jgi:hypothetical protein